MRIALFTETFLPQTNGVVRTIEKIIRHLEANGHEVLLFCIGDGDKHYSQSEVIRVEGIKLNLYPELNLVKPEDPWLSKLLENDLAQVPLSLLQTLIPAKHSLVEKALLNFKPDLIHLATPATLGAIGIYYVDKLQIPCLSTFHTDIASYAPKYQLPYATEIINAITKLIYSRTDKILAPSPSSRQQLESIGLKNIGVFGRGVDSQLFNPNKREKNFLNKFGLSESLITLTYTGRLAEEKSIPELINVFKKIQNKYPIQLLLIGEGPLRPKLEADLKDVPNHHFAGLQTGETLAKLYASSDIFGFPSKTETFGQVILEAMSSGLPVVGYKSQGVKDLVNHQTTGLLANNEDEFENSLIQLIESEEQRSKLGFKAREEAELRSWDNILNGLLQEYEFLIKS